MADNWVQPERTIRHRNEIIERIKIGKMTPEEAEARIARFKQPPLANRPDPSKFDPMQEGFWDIPMAIAWMMTKSPPHVRQLWNAYRAESRRWQRLGVGFVLKQEEPVTTLDLAFTSGRLKVKKIKHTPYKEAKQQLWKQAERGKIAATGVPSHGGRRIAIPPAEWRDLKLRQVGNRVLLRYRWQPSVGYDDVLFARAELVVSHRADSRVEPTSEGPHNAPGGIGLKAPAAVIEPGQGHPLGVAIHSADAVAATALPTAKNRYRIEIWQAAKIEFPDGIPEAYGPSRLKRLLMPILREENLIEVAANPSPKTFGRALEKYPKRRTG